MEKDAVRLLEDREHKGEWRVEYEDDDSREPTGQYCVRKSLGTGSRVVSNEYRERAAECFRLASRVNDPQQRAVLLEMARAWLRLHDQAEKNAQTEQRALLLEMAIGWLRLHDDDEKNAQADPTNKTPQPSIPQQRQQQQQRAQPKVGRQGLGRFSWRPRP